MLHITPGPCLALQVLPFTSSHLDHVHTPRGRLCAAGLHLLQGCQRASSRIWNMQGLRKAYQLVKNGSIFTYCSAAGLKRRAGSRSSGSCLCLHPRTQVSHGVWDVRHTWKALRWWSRLPLLQYDDLMPPNRHAAAALVQVYMQVQSRHSRSHLSTEAQERSPQLLCQATCLCLFLLALHWNPLICPSRPVS